MFYLIRGKSKHGAISVARDGDPTKIADAIAGLRESGFTDIVVLDATGREIDGSTFRSQVLPAQRADLAALAALPHVSRQSDARGVAR